MNRYYFESFVGISILLAASLMTWAFFSTDRFCTSTQENISVSAYFSTVAGISKGADVKLSGVKIGTVSGVKLDPESLQAILTLHISKAYNIPSDSTFAIKSDGLMGGKFVAVTAGTGTEKITEGMTFLDNQSSMDLEGVIGQAMFGGNKDQKSKE